ncbi:MAG: hypothetical protein ABJB12_12385 [Pseudomonadota bacterium]
MKSHPLRRLKSVLFARPWLLILLVTAAPFVPGALQFFRLGVPDVLAFGDNATLEIRTLNVLHGTQLLGPYSRFGWSHPGPAFFYLAFPVYELFHQHGPALNVFVLACNFTAAIALVINADKLRGELFALATALLLAMYAAVGARFGLSEDWNPVVPVLPLALLLLLSVRIAQGAIEILPWFLFVASAMVQTHLGFLPATVFLFVAASLFGIRPFRGQRLWQTARRRVALSGLMAALVLLVSWAPPAYENFTAHPGNLSTLWTFFSSPHQAEHSVREAIQAVAKELAVFPLAVAGLFLDRARDADITVCGALALAETGALAFAVWFGFRRRDRTAAVFCCLVLGLIAVSVVSARAVRGEMKDYLLTWVSVVGLTAHIAVLSLVFREGGAPAWERRARTMLCVIGLPLLGLSLWRAGDKPMFQPHDADLERVAEQLEAYLRASHIERPTLHVATRGTWPKMAGLALSLYKHDVPVAVEDAWLSLVGPRFQAGAAPRFELAVANRRLNKGYELISSAGNTFVYLRHR